MLPLGMVDGMRVLTIAYQYIVKYAQFVSLSHTRVAILAYQIVRFV